MSVESTGKIGSLIDRTSRAYSDDSHIFETYSVCYAEYLLLLSHSAIRRVYFLYTLALLHEMNHCVSENPLLLCLGNVE